MKGIAQLPFKYSGLELVTWLERQILPFLSENGHVGLVGTEGDEGSRGQRSTGVNQVRRVETHFIDYSFRSFKTKLTV